LKQSRETYSKIGMLPSTEAERLGVSVGKDVSTLRTILGQESTRDAPIGLGSLLDAPAGAGEPLALTAKAAGAMGRTARGIEDYAKSMPSYVKKPVMAAVQAPVNLKKQQ
jgi:hypothetical protein